MRGITYGPAPPATNDLTAVAFVVNRAQSSILTDGGRLEDGGH